MGKQLRAPLFRELVTKIRTKVRYRLLFLTSIPVFITMIALVLLSIYWATSYTWQSALADVSERLKIAENHIRLLQKEQVNSISVIGESYALRQSLLSGGNTDNEINAWLSDLNNKTHLAVNDLDGLRWRSAVDIAAEFGTGFDKPYSFYQILNGRELMHWSQKLSVQALVYIHDTDKNETRALVSRIIYPVYDSDNTLLGFLDGILLINNNQQIVDDIKALVYPEVASPTAKSGAVTIFLDDLRISTNVPMDSYTPNSRALGTRVSEQVKQKVLRHGENYLDRAYVLDSWYVSAYEPLIDHNNNNIVGMLYVGHQIWPLIETYIINLGEIALVVFIVLMVSGYVVHLGTRDLFHPIEKISSVVNAIQHGEDKRIGRLHLAEKHELAILAGQFDQMLDQLAFRNQQIEQAAAELEDKVRDRTASLHEKTRQLEHHIDLLNQTRDKLIVSEKLAALGQLTAGIAHEINNPMAVILGNAELIRMELGDNASTVDEELSVIFDQINRIRHITQSLLQYSRSGSTQDIILVQDINAVVAESITLVKTGTKQKEIRFSANYSATEPVECNRNQLLQILVNLQVNAIQAMQGKGTIFIHTEDWLEGSLVKGVTIHVQDEGPGIKAEYLSKVFDPFYTTKSEGTGLGLSVSQSLIDRIGGEIRAESEYGNGAKFSLYLHKQAKFS